MPKAHFRKGCVRAVLRAPGASLARVLGPDGDVLRGLCLDSGACVAFRPDLESEHNEYILEVSGDKSGVSRAEIWLGELLEGDGLPHGAAAGGGRSAQDAHSQADDEDAEPAHVEEFEFPRWKSEFVLDVRRCGEKGLTKEEGLHELQTLCGLERLELGRRRAGGESLQLRACGQADALTSFLEVMDERLAACEDIVMEFLDVPSGFLETFIGRPHDEPTQQRADIEVESGALLSCKHHHMGESRKWEDVVCLRGTAGEVERARKLVREILPKSKTNGSGRG